MTGKNDNEHWFLACSGFEIYGDLSTGSRVVPYSQIDTDSAIKSKDKMEEKMKDDSIQNCKGILHSLAYDFKDNDDEKSEYKDPLESGKIDLFHTGMGADSEAAETLIGIRGDATRTYLKDRPLPWFGVDFKENRVSPTHYSLRHYASKNVECMRYWHLEGSIDGKLWDIIDQHKADETFQRKGQIATFKVKESDSKYRYLRVKMVRPNENDHWFLCCAGFEVYGLIIGNVGYGGAKVDNKADGSSKDQRPKWPKTFTYKSDFDKNGIIYGIATNFGEDGKKTKYSNPVVDKKIAVYASKLKSNSRTVETLCKRSPGRLIAEGERCWVALNFGALKVTPTAYTLRHYTSWDREALRSWEFQGSTDGQNWITLKKHEHDMSLHQRGKSRTWMLNDEATENAKDSNERNTEFTSFRILMTDVNDNGHWFLCLGGFEIYGTVTVGYRVFTYESDFDKNGILYAIGTAFGRNPEWKNPALNNLVNVITNPETTSDSEPKHRFIGRTQCRCILNEKESSYFIVDFKDRQIKPTAYTLRNYVSWEIEALKNWDLCGSKDGKSWDIIMSHSDNTDLKGKGKAFTWKIEDCNSFYSQFKVVITGKNNNDHNMLCCAGFEIYGIFHEESAANFIASGMGMSGPRNVLTLQQQIKESLTKYSPSFMQGNTLSVMYRYEPDKENVEYKVFSFDPLRNFRFDILPIGVPMG